MPVFDVNGNILSYEQDYLSSNTDGAQGAKNECLVLYNSGGPPLLGGIPSLLAFDRLRSLQGKAVSGNQTITSTVAGDTQLTCAAGVMKTAMPGQPVKLSGSGQIETVYVSTTYVPSSGATSIPLQSPVVNTGQTIANWEIYNYNGPVSAALQATGILPVANVVVDAVGNSYYLQRGASSDTLSPNGLTAVAAVGYNGSNVSERMRSPNVFKPFNAQAVTISSANTPTSIWTPAAGKKFRLMGYWFSTTAAAGLIFHDLASIGGTGLMPIPSPIHAAGGVIQSPPQIKNGILSATINNQLWIDATAATTLTGFAWGMEE